MSELEMTGAVIGAIITILTLFSIFVKLIIEPVNKLTVSVTELVGALDGIIEKQSKFETKLDRHDDRLDNVEIRLARNQIA